MKKTLMRTITIISFLLILFSNTSIANATSYSSEWKIQSVSSNKSGNSATASATANYASLKNYTQNVTISCNKNGTVS